MKERPRTAVIADVDEFFRMALAGILERELGIGRVIQCHSVELVLGAEAGHDPLGLIVLEASLLGSDYGLIRSLRRQHPRASVVVVSSSPGREDVFRSLDAGAHGHVPKGGSISEMAHALRMVLDGVLWLPPFIAAMEEHGPAVAATAQGSAPASPPGGLEALTARQLEVLRLVVMGKSNKEIARLMKLREGTIKVHMAGLFRNLGVANRSSAAVLGARLFARRPDQP